MNIKFPYKFDESGRTAGTNYERHIREMIDQVLFTIPGERVNRPTFGCGLRQLVFQPNSDELSSATQYLVQSSLQQWLGDRIQVDEVIVKNDDSRLSVTVTYTIRLTGNSETAVFSHGGS